MAGDVFEADVMSLFTDDGERKYLNAAERKRFFRARKTITDRSERTFVELIFWTGCRISEALQLTIIRVNVEEAFVVFKTLKQHGKNKDRKFRVVHVPRRFMRDLDRALRLQRPVETQCHGPSRRIWKFGRQKGWRLVSQVMSKAGISGPRATPRGLRHSFGVHCILNGIPELRLQDWMGHTSLSTTSIYAKAIGAEDRYLIKRIWRM
jgi:integrase/recombinase XerD